MKLTKERAIYATILGVGLSALALEQMVLPGTPSQAAGAPADPAAAASEYAVPRAAGGVKGSPAPKESFAVLSVAEQLRGFGRMHDVDVKSLRDVFQPPAALDKSTQVVEKASLSAPSRMDRFKQVHSLNGVMVANRQSKAIVDGKMLLVGQSLDGFKLVSVTQQVAEFESEAGRVVLKIPENPGTAAGSSSS